MKEPLFKIGEEVILYSNTHPKLDGDCVVLDILLDYFRDTHTGYVNLQIGYKLNVNDEWWGEKSLRKKYQPSTQSFEEIKQEIRQTKA